MRLVLMSEVLAHPTVVDDGALPAGLISASVDYRRGSTRAQVIEVSGERADERVKLRHLAHAEYYHSSAHFHRFSRLATLQLALYEKMSWFFEEEVVVIS